MTSAATSPLTLAAGVLGARLSRVIGEDVRGELVGALLELIDDGVVQRVLVLLQPADQVVGHLLAEMETAS